MSNVLFVTGGTGLIGNNVVRAALQAGFRVRVLLRPTSDRRSFAGLDVEPISGDLANISSLRDGCAEASAVVHAAADVRIGWSMRGGIGATNVQGTENIAKVARISGTRMVHVATVNRLAVPRLGMPPASEETPLSGAEIMCNYVRTKRMASACIADQVRQGLQATTVDPGFVLGPWDWKPSSGRMLLAVAGTWTPLAPRGGCSVTDARDVARAIVEICQRGSTIFHNYILAGHNVTYFDLWKAMARVSNRRGPRRVMGPVVGRCAGRLADIAGWIRGTEGDINSAALAMSSQFHYYDSQRAEQEFGYEPRPLDETLTDAWQWFTHQSQGITGGD